MEWQPIWVRPKEPMTVLFYSKNRTWSDGSGDIFGENGEPFSMFQPYRDERADLGYWDGKEFRWQGTGHAVWECGYNDRDLDLPTHWMPLPEPPK